MFGFPNGVRNYGFTCGIIGFFPNGIELMSKTKPVRKKVASPFAKNLKRILDERGISQRGAAEIAQTNVAVINDWLGGAVPHDHGAVLRLCKALKCDFQWLLTDSHTETKIQEMTLQEIFETESDPAFSGIFQIEAKRLKRRSE